MYCNQNKLIMKYFNRHKNMNPETSSKVMDLINCLEFHHRELMNYLYGLFDGYNYQGDVFKTEGAKYLKENDPLNYQKLKEVYYIVNRYPRITEEDVVCVNIR